MVTSAQIALRSWPSTRKRRAKTHYLLRRELLATGWPARVAACGGYKLRRFTRNEQLVTCELCRGELARLRLLGGVLE